MKKCLFIIAVLSLLYACCKSEKKNEVKPKTPKGAVDLGIVITREDGTTYTLYWAESNLSESGLCARPEDCGDYYAWGETAAKSDYSWSTYKWVDASVSLTKYNTDISIGVKDNKTALDPEDDVARAKLGGKWRMPTDAEWTALREQCEWKWTGNYNGTARGRIVTGPNGNSIFLPTAGYRGDTSLKDTDSYGGYWSSSLSTEDPNSAFSNAFGFDDVYRESGYRYYGQSVRPVSE